MRNIPYYLIILLVIFSATHAPLKMQMNGLAISDNTTNTSSLASHHTSKIASNKPGVKVVRLWNHSGIRIVICIRVQCTENASYCCNWVAYRWIDDRQFRDVEVPENETQHFRYNKATQDVCAAGTAAFTLTGNSRQAREVYLR